jgi:hypothetical protein
VGGWTGAAALRTHLREAARCLIPGLSRQAARRRVLVVVQVDPPYEDRLACIHLRGGTTHRCGNSDV